MAFINARLSDRVAEGFSGGPEYNTLVTPLENGWETRNGLWLYPKHRYSAPYHNVSPSIRNEILATMHVCRGRLHVFRFKDRNDYSGTTQPFQQINGAWQMVKEYDFGGESSTRLVQAPVVGEISLSGGSLSNLDFETGIYDGDATGLTWTGEFDVWVRFDADHNAFSMAHQNAQSTEVGLYEVRRRIVAP